MLKELFEEHGELLENIEEAVATKYVKTGILEDYKIVATDVYSTLEFDENCINLRISIETDASINEQTEEHLQDILNEVFGIVIPRYMSDEISAKFGSAFDCEDIFEVTEYEVLLEN